MADNTLGSSASAVSAQPELSIHDGTVTTTSLQVAQFFGKRHRDVLRAIRTLTQVERFGGHSSGLEGRPVISSSQSTGRNHYPLSRRLS